MSAFVRRVRGASAVLALLGSAAAPSLPTATGQAAILVRPRGVVTADVPRVNHAEPWVAVDPRNPARLVATGILDSGGESVAYSSRDGGVTWSRGRTDRGNTTFPGGDPIALFDSRGTAFLATISPFRVWRSNDAGVTWDGPTMVPGRSFDREYLAVRTVPDGPDTLYAVAKTPIRVFGHLASDALALAKSVDRGQTFEAPRLFLPDPTHSIIHVAGGLVVAANGELFVSFMAHDVPVSDPATLKNHIWVMRSPDGGRTFRDPVAAATSVVYGNRGDELKMLKSLAGARITMDTSAASAFRGRLYLSYLTVLDRRLQVVVTASRDSGQTWSAPVRVNDDAGTANHSNPQIAVNDRGDVAVVWNDRRADPRDLCFRTTVSVSLDGGATFLPSVPVEATSTCPLGENATPPFKLDGFTGRYVQGGETQGLAALPGRRFLAVFVGGGATMQLRSVVIEIVPDRDQR